MMYGATYLIRRRIRSPQQYLHRERKISVENEDDGRRGDPAGQPEQLDLAVDRHEVVVHEEG